VPMKESQPPDPLNIYAFSKLVMERMAARYAQRLAHPIVGLRYSNVYGPGEDHKGRLASMIHQLARQATRAGHPGRLDQIKADLYLGLLDGRFDQMTGEQIINELVDHAGCDRAATGVEVSVELATLLGRNEHPATCPGLGPILAHIARRIVVGRHGGEMRGIQTSAPQRPLRVVGSRSHPSPQTAAFLTRLGPHVMSGVGSSLKFCLLAEGEADLYPRFGATSEWDTAAGQAVLEAAGGHVTRMDGHRMRYNCRESLINGDFVAFGDPSVLPA